MDIMYDWRQIRWLPSYIEMKKEGLLLEDTYQRWLNDRKCNKKSYLWSAGRKLLTIITIKNKEDFFLQYL